MVINVLEYLERTAKNNPDTLALKDQNESVSYSEYLIRAKTIGSYIARSIKAQNSPVIVLIDRNIKSIISFIGVAYSGNFYVPLDTSMPEERQKLILESLRPVMIINASGNEPGEFLSSIKIPLVNYDQIGGVINEDILRSIREDSIDTDPLYCLFTSGSTGVPKGVLVSHRSVIDLAEEFHYTFGFDSECIWGNQAPFDFDVSVKDIYNAIFNGGSIVVVPKELFVMPGKLIDFINDYKINTLIWAVSALRIVSDFHTFDDHGSIIHQMRYIMFSGEVMPVKALKYWQQHVNKAMYVNLYGPTEITCNCTYHIVDENRDYNVLPIGKPFRNTRIIILDENNKVISSVGQVGELCVEGSSLALGYWNNQDQTQKSFVNRPDVGEYPCKIYRTGDLACYDEDGNLVFKSRKDHQIKHMGHRIELGEIENSINAMPFIDVCCCIYDEEENKIICYYQGKCETKKEIVMELVKKLPKYMWPNRYIKMESLPLNSHGKIDRKSLESL